MGPFPTVSNEGVTGLHVRSKNSSRPSTWLYRGFFTFIQGNLAVDHSVSDLQVFGVASLANPRKTFPLRESLKDSRRK
jgi:hypothetical protein